MGEGKNKYEFSFEERIKEREGEILLGFTDNRNW